MKDMAEVKLACPVCGHDMVFQIPASDVRLRVTNADRIRAMSDEEFALFLYDRGCFAPNCNKMPDGECYGGCNICWLEWLKAEASE